MKNKNAKKVYLLISTYLIFLLVPKLKNNSKEITYNKDYVYESTIPYASYSNGDVYIINEDLLQEI